MSVLLRTRDVPAHARAEFVREVVAAALGPLDVRTGDGNEVPDQVRAADLGAIRVGELSASRPGGADRRRRHVRLLDADLCKVDVVAQGEVVVEQDGRQERSSGGPPSRTRTLVAGSSLRRAATTLPALPAPMTM